MSHILFTHMLIQASGVYVPCVVCCLWRHLYVRPIC